MCKNDKLILLSIEERINSMLADINIIEANKQVSKDKLTWLKAKFNDIYRLVHTIKEKVK